ncbi:dimethylaniline monooxygenase [Massarina eburnea CBS 473.64]|uniref:Dimethylaniline monooxygenase n=1 Tax=Massarina eburnea CBS 473.64 TaxID=1395130 RepID=A0A6A6S1L9_9PLEO|nr:dimethylaniline monooxygenase [Massarina eburnea CBS 473.64]
MAPRYSSVAVIGGGPSGISAIKALSEEKIFSKIRLFDRRQKVGGTWLFDEVPEPFSPHPKQPQPNPPAAFPKSAAPEPENVTARTGLYSVLDSNVGSEAMAFTYKPFPPENSAASIHRLGRGNFTRPWETVAHYLEEIVEPFTHLITLNTHVERVEKRSGKWVLTLRRTDHVFKGEKKDYWWQEEFDAVVVATGHYTVPNIPSIPGLEEVASKRPEVFEHSKAYRNANDYVNKKVIVVGGNVSASDAVTELYNIVSGPLYISQRGHNEILDPAWNLPNVVRKSQINNIRIDPDTGINVTFSDGSEVKGIDKVHFATGYHLSYPFLNPNPVTPNGRLAGFYHHVFNITDPSLTVVGQVKAAISFRVYEYQAVAVARYFAGRGGGLPSPRAQDDWQVERLQYKGPTSSFHEIKPDFAEYFGFLRAVAGKPAEESDGYELPEWEDEWAVKGFAVLAAKTEWWKKLKEEAEANDKIKAKL